MLIHIVPKLFEPPFAVESEVVDVSIPELGLVLDGGKEITARRPYPNKRYLVACKKTGQKAISGIFVEVDDRLETYTVITRWSVNGEVITHVVQHEIVDSDFDTVSDDMLLWSSWYGTTWQQRWPECYKGDPTRRGREPSMDVLTHSDGGALKPADVQDVVCGGQRVIMRFESFAQCTIERERLLEQKGGMNSRTPKITDAFKAKQVVMPNMSMELNNGLVAHILLVPMPTKDAYGVYPQFTGKRAFLMPDAYLSFSRAGKIIAANFPWEDVITDSSTYQINKDVSLSEDDLYEIDEKGWEIMGQLGMFPTSFALMVSCETA